MYNIHCATARHFEAFADIPQELADTIVAYRKIRKRIFHIDELYRIGGISRKYFGRLISVSMKKRKMKIKKCENQRKIEKRDRKRELKRDGISTQYKPLGEKCNLNSTNLKRLTSLSTHRKLAEKLGKKILKKEGKIGKYRIVKRRKTTRRANINERVDKDRLLVAIPKLEGDNKDMEEDNWKKTLTIFM
jgi:hypothetical protein